VGEDIYILSGHLEIGVCFTVHPFYFKEKNSQNESFSWLERPHEGLMTER
jgi:hypothetical protein